MSAPVETETGFQDAIVEFAETCGWKTYHTYDSRRSNGGWPDLVLVRVPVALFVELKRDARSKPTPAQQQWIDALRGCGIDARVWRPDDWPEIKAVLNRNPKTPAALASTLIRAEKMRDGMTDVPARGAHLDQLCAAVVKNLADADIDFSIPLVRNTTARVLELVMLTLLNKAQDATPDFADAYTFTCRLFAAAGAPL